MCHQLLAQGQHHAQGSQAWQHLDRLGSQHSALRFWPSKNRSQNREGKERLQPIRAHHEVAGPQCRTTEAQEGHLTTCLDPLLSRTRDYRL